jgi:hypothetical protein
MKWLLIVGGVLASLVVIMAIVGAMLPKAHTATGAQSYPGQSAAQLFARAEQLVASDTEVPVDIVERVEPSRLVTRIKPGQPFGGSWIIEVADGRVSITEDGEVYNPIFRFLARFVFGHTATIEQALKKL